MRPPFLTASFKSARAVRVIPVPGKGVGDNVEFGGLLGHCPIINVNKYKSDEFIARGGRIPAPMRSLTN